VEFNNSFSVDAPLETVWTFMLNAQEVAPCVPGAQITEVIDDTHYKGTVKIKLGAVQMTYRGELQMEPNEAERVIVLRARGTEARGSGGASGTFTTTLTPAEGGGTTVDIRTDVDVTGRVAQFGRGLMQDVANRLIREFAQCLERKIGEVASSSGERSGDQTATDAASVSPELERETVPNTPAAAPAPEPAALAAPHAATPPVAPSTRPPAGQEISMQDLLLEILRSRAAGWLRALADRIEPK
jgi:carbon monoxide dehydrogenase subunit G